MEKQALYIDPRTKLFLLLVMNIVMLDTSSGVLLPYLRFIIGFLPFVLLLTSKRFKPAWVYLVIYLISHIIVLYVLDYTSGFMMMLLGFLSSMGTKFLPGGMLGVYFSVAQGKRIYCIYGKNACIAKGHYSCFCYVSLFYDSKGGGRRDQRCYENEKIRIFIFLF